MDLDELSEDDRLLIRVIEAHAPCSRSLDRTLPEQEDQREDARDERSRRNGDVHRRSLGTPSRTAPTMSDVRRAPCLVSWRSLPGCPVACVSYQLSRVGL
jgi:hypothetical protein